MYTLVDAQAMAEQNPISFTVPEDSQLDNLKIGDFAKLCFNEKERLWVFITEIDGDKFKGTIDNEPMCFQSYTIWMKWSSSGKTYIKC